MPPRGVYCRRRGTAGRSAWWCGGSGGSQSLSSSFSAAIESAASRRVAPDRGQHHNERHQSRANLLFAASCFPQRRQVPHSTHSKILRRREQIVLKVRSLGSTGVNARGADDQAEGSTVALPTPRLPTIGPWLAGSAQLGAGNRSGRAGRRPLWRIAAGPARRQLARSP